MSAYEDLSRELERLRLALHDRGTAPAPPEARDEQTYEIQKRYEALKSKRDAKRPHDYVPGWCEVVAGTELEMSWNGASQSREWRLRIPDENEALKILTNFDWPSYSEGMIKDFALAHPTERTVLESRTGAGAWYIEALGSSPEDLAERPHGTLYENATSLHELHARPIRIRAEIAAERYEAEKARQQKQDEFREQLEKSVAAAKFSRCEIEIPLSNGSKRLVKGLAYGGLMVYRDNTTYVVTHVKTGMALGLCYDAQKEAKAAVVRLSTIIGWDFEELSDENREKVSPVVKIMKNSAYALGPECGYA